MKHQFLRPEVLDKLMRWREMAVATAVILLGLWVFGFGGWFFQALGVLIGLTGVAGVLIALRRMKFLREVAQPGVIEVDEGQIRYFGPEGGGFIALREVVELGLQSDASGQSWWSLREADGTVLLVPTSATGAETLFDAFSAFPGIDMGALGAALSDEGTSQSLWRRTDQGPSEFIPLENSRLH